MIAASRRRRTERGDAFRLHEALAARASLSVRLRRGAVLALVASVAALALGADVATHLLAVALGLAVGAAVPVRGAREEALAYIRGRAGLSYETALDVVSAAAEDEFGLRSAVVERARLAVRDVRPEPAPAWWLPALAVAVGLVLFSLAGPSGLVGSGGGGGASQPGGQVPPAPEAAQGEDRQEQAPAPPEASPGRADEGGSSQKRDEDDAAQGPGAAPPGGDGSAAAPLSRFLDSLRERPDGSPPPDRPGAPGRPGAQPPRADAPASPSQGQGDPERVQLDPRSQAEGQQGEGNSPQGDDGRGQQEGDDQGQPDADQGQEQGRQPGQGGEDGEGEGGGEPSPSQQPGGQGGQAPEAGGDPGDGAGETKRGLMPDDGSQTPDPDDAVGAGAGPGAGAEAGVAPGEAGAPELLPGVLQDGPENPAGTVRLPGDADVYLPPGRAPAEYQAAAEEALSEGDLPLAYQEVIRRYFR